MGISVDVDVSIDKDASKAVRNAHERRLMDAATKGFAVSQERVPSDRGTLRRSGFPPEKRSRGTVVWGYDAPYAKAQEFGTVPYYPPAQPLVEWAERVFGDGSIGYAVQEKIAQEGIEPKGYAQAGRDSQESFLQSHRFDDYLSREL